MNMELLKAIKNPKQYVLGMAKNTQNPMLNKLIEYANNGQTDKLEEFARNYAKENGKDFDKDYNALKSMFTRK